MKVKKAVIAAAGLNSRFLPVSKGVTKGLIPVLAKPCIQYLVEEVIGAGIDQIAIVHNHGDPSIKRYFTPDPSLKKTLQEKGKQELIESLEKIWREAKTFKFYPQPRKRLPYGNATPILVTKSFIKNESFVYMFGDDMVVEDRPGQYLSHLIKIFKKYQPSLVLGAQEVPRQEVCLYGTIQYTKDSRYPNRAVKLIEKPRPEQILSNIIQFGRFVFSPKILEVLADLPIRNNELWLADANNILAKTEVVIAEPIKNGYWITTGDPLRWLKTNLAFAWKNPEMKKELEKFLKEKF